MLAAALLVAGCASATQAQTPARAAAVDPMTTRLPAAACRDGSARNPGQERTQVAAAVAPVEAAQKARMAEFDGSAEPSGEAREAVLQRLERRYRSERFIALWPLARDGNARAIFELASHYRRTESGATDEMEWLRLTECAAALGDGPANVELMRVYWHGKGGDGAFGPYPTDRARALDLVDRAAAAGDMGGVGSIGIYVGAGYHLYPVNPDVGRRVLTLCANTGDAFCRRSLVEAALLGRDYAPLDPVDAFVAAAQLAARQPGLNASARDRLKAALTPAQLAVAEARLAAWRPTPWAALHPQWLALRAEILASDCPPPVTCRRGAVCRCRG